MDRNYVFDNAPLKEVIVECYWRLKPISVAPGAAIDPFREEFEAAFGDFMAKNGFRFQETIAPDNFPREFLAQQVTKRFRPQPNKWPVYQIGPGIMTINETPPYDGWRNFSEHVLNGFEFLLQAYPSPDRYLRFERLVVRYLNTFGQRHGLVQPGHFVSEQLRLGVDLPEKVWREAGDRAEAAQFAGSVTLPIARLSNGSGAILWRTVTEDGKPAVLLEFRLTEALEGVHLISDDLLRLANQCHDVISDWFEQIVEMRLGDAIGSRRMLRDG